MERQLRTADSAQQKSTVAKSAFDLQRSLVESLSEYAVFGISPAGDILTWNTGAENIFGYVRADVIGEPFAMLFPPADAAAGAPRMQLADARLGRRLPHERWLVRKDGRLFWATASVTPIVDPGRVRLGFAAIVADTSDGHRAREALRESEERMRQLIEGVPEYAIFSLAADGSIATWNSGAQRVLGYAPDEIVGKPFAQLFAPDDVANDVPAIVLQKTQELGTVDEERWFVRKDGSRFLGSEKIGRLATGSAGAAPGSVHVAHDITARNRIAAEIARRSSLDQLTELANRSTFFDHVHRAIAAMKRRSSNLFAVLFIDLDHFKDVNDTYGHFMADRLLEITARRLEHCARAEDIVARIGGDEFAVLLNGISDIGDARDAADRISAQTRKPVPIDRQDVHATVSVGIAMGSARYERPEDILRDADAAMYVAKANGRGRSCVFTVDLAVDSRTALALESELRHALERNELRVVYQPIVRLADSKVVGFEALVRWQHPRRGLLVPSEFLLKAEESRLIVDVDRWVLREACKTLALWRSGGRGAGLSIGINFSGHELADPDVLDEVRHVLRMTALPPSALHLEISESAIVERSERAAALLGSLRDMGVELHVDDFGVGYSSLAALARWPVSAVKIDRSFVTAFASRNGRALVQSMTHLAHNLGLGAIAKGIERPDELADVRAAGCDFGQGHLFSEPLEADAAWTFLA